MPRHLKDLLELHAFCRDALERQALMPAEATEKLKEWQSRAFSDIFAYKSKNPKITLAQIRFAMACIADEAAKSGDADVLRKAAERQTARLQTMLVDAERQRRRGSLTDFRALDALTDRVAIIDREYRYVFTNRANLEFHNAALPAFEQRPSWDMTGERFFVAANKPRFDACFAGHVMHGVSARPDGRTFATTYTPIRDADGEIRRIILVAREITGLPIPPESVERIELAAPVNPRP